MTILKILTGALLLAYPVFAAIGLGLSICVFLGVLFLMWALYGWFKQTRNNMQILAYKLSKGLPNEQVSRDISSLR